MSTTIINQASANLSSVLPRQERELKLALPNQPTSPESQVASTPDELSIQPKKSGVPTRILIGVGSGAATGGVTLGTFMAGRLIKDGLTDAIVVTGEKLVKGPIILESSIVGGAMGGVAGGVIGTVTGGIIGTTTGMLIDDPKTAAVVSGAIGLTTIAVGAMALRGNFVNSLGLGLVGGSSGAVSAYLVSSFK